MIDARSLWQFDPPMARVLREFILHPSAGLHADRWAQLWPGDASVLTLKPSGEAALSRALMQVLELNEQVELDLEQPLHRCALLPEEGLACLVRALEVRVLAPRLRRVILRSELQQLQQCLLPEDWARAMSVAHDAGAGLMPAALLDVPVDELIALFDHLGWLVLDLAYGVLPASVALRARLKLPLKASLTWTEGLSESKAAGLVQAVYADAVGTWSESWDDGWLSRRAA